MSAQINNIRPEFDREIVDIVDETKLKEYVDNKSAIFST